MENKVSTDITKSQELHNYIMNELPELSLDNMYDLMNLFLRDKLMVMDLKSLMKLVLGEGLTQFYERTPAFRVVIQKYFMDKEGWLEEKSEWDKI